MPKRATQKSSGIENRVIEPCNTFFVDKHIKYPKFDTYLQNMPSTTLTYIKICSKLKKALSIWEGCPIHPHCNDP